MKRVAFVFSILGNSWGVLVEGLLMVYAHRVAYQIYQKDSNSIRGTVMGNVRSAHSRFTCGTIRAQSIVSMAIGKAGLDRSMKTESIETFLQTVTGLIPCFLSFSIIKKRAMFSWTEQRGSPFQYLFYEARNLIEMLARKKF